MMLISCVSSQDYVMNVWISVLDCQKANETYKRKFAEELL